jgi:small nuclear ribonucleoprotein (snRNP)-like protein
LLTCLLYLCTGRPVIVKLNSGVSYRGEAALTPSSACALPHSFAFRPCFVQACWRALTVSQPTLSLRATRCTSLTLPALFVCAFSPGYMNVALEQTEEYVDGQLKTKYGDTFIRGNNILYIRYRQISSRSCVAALVQLLCRRPSVCRLCCSTQKRKAKAPGAAGASSAASSSKMEEGED